MLYLLSIRYWLMGLLRPCDWRQCSLVVESTGAGVGGPGLCWLASCVILLCQSAGCVIFFLVCLLSPSVLAFCMGRIYIRGASAEYLELG